MSSSFNNPAEFPEGELSEFTTGGRGTVRPGHGGGGGPAELPPFTRYSVAQLVSEVLNLNTRVQSVETELMSVRLSRGVSRHLPGVRPGGGPHEFPQFMELQRGGGPQELEMEGGEGTSTGGGGTRFRPRFEIHEFQPGDVAKLLQSVAQVNERLSALESRVTEVLQKISER